MKWYWTEYSYFFVDTAANSYKLTLYGILSAKLLLSTKLMSNVNLCNILQCRFLFSILLALRPLNKLAAINKFNLADVRLRIQNSISVVYNSKLTRWPKSV